MTHSKISNSLTWVIGGAQGSGVDSAANIFSKACSQAGLCIFGKREYYSNIKGEHSYFTVRVSDKQIRSHVDDIDLLVSFDAETLFRHSDKVTKDGAIIYDQDLVNITIQEVPTLDDQASKKITTMLEKANKPLTVQGMLDYAKDNGTVLYNVPYFQLLRDFSEKISDHSLSKLTRTINVMALSASMAVLDFDTTVLAKAIKYIFRAKPKIAELNIAAANYSYNYVKSRFHSTEFRFKLTCIQPSSDIILMQGNQSSAMGKITAGCRFQTYYPITPASDDSEFLESNQIIEQTYDNRKKGSIVVVQTEDEIAAITMAIGGALTGVRSATATSGPGFSLMAEALGWAGINEVPVVVSLYQRAGPSTGLPTRHEQGDLMFAINCGHGEFPKIVFASGDIEESFYDTIKAFNFAEKYQLPVIHMLDKAIANSIMTCKVFDQHRINIDRGRLVEYVIPAAETGVAGNYLRFKLDENPISPRIRLGTENGVFWNTGDEHTEEGHITEDPDNRIKMMNKRMSKLDFALNEIPDEDKAIEYGHDLSSGDGMTIVSWGSTKGAILDAIDQLTTEGKNVKFVQLRLMHPFPSSLVAKMLENTRVLVDVEMNYMGQLGLLIKQNLNRDINYSIVKYNGRSMSSSEVYNALMRIMNGNAPRRIVLEHGT